jgi:cytochrome c oxidase subunit III
MKAPTNTIYENKENTEVAESLKIATSVALISFGMLFATLMLGFFIFRVSNEVWPPMGMTRPDILLPSLMSAVLVISSFGLEKWPKRSLLFVVFGGIYLPLQILFWRELRLTGLIASAGIFPSILNAFTWVHFAHTVCAWPYLFLSFTRLSKKHQWVSKGFWHFLTGVWLVLYLLLFWI